MTDSAVTSTPNADKAPSTSRKPAFVTNAAHNLMDKAAKKLKISNIDYASAAIAYFASNGLDPTAQETLGLISMQAKMSEVGLEIRKHNADIGNRLLTILRTWEANQYDFMQAQQAGVVAYLENIEANILNHQVEVESQVLAPLLEQVVSNGIEANMARIFTEVLWNKFEDKKYPFSSADRKLMTAQHDDHRDRRLIAVLEKLLKAAPVATPTLTPKPAIVVPVKGTSIKSTGTATPAGAAPAPPKV